MISSFYTSLSGLNAFQRQLSVTAHNVANVNTDGFKKSRTVLESTPPQGVVAKSEKLELPGPLALEQTPDGEQLVEQSNVDIGEEAVSLMTGRRAYEASLRTLKITDEALGSLLDIVDR